MLSSLLQLIRWKNLLIVFGAQWIIWIFIHQQYMNILDLKLSLPWMILLVSSTILIAAAGYIINDYFDIKIDSINRPNTLIVTNKVSKFAALITHIGFSIVGFLIAFIVAYKVGLWWLCGIQLMTIALLWYYSTHFKRMALIGNYLVSFLTALSILLMLIFEPGFYAYIGAPLRIDDSYNPAWMIIGISVFAFLLNLMREVVKDMEDFKGDAEQGCRTLPIVKGLTYSTTYVQVVGWLSVVVLTYVSLYIAISVHYIHGILLFLPNVGLIAVMYRLPKHTIPAHYAALSALIKWIMILGLCIFILINYIR